MTLACGLKEFVYVLSIVLLLDLKLGGFHSCILFGIENIKYQDSESGVPLTVSGTINQLVSTLDTRRATAMTNNTTMTMGVMVITYLKTNVNIGVTSIDVLCVMSLCLMWIL